MEQKQWQGMERRQSSGFYEGLERRKPKPVFEEPAGNSGKATQDQKQHARNRDDTQ